MAQPKVRKDRNEYPCDQCSRTATHRILWNTGAVQFVCEEHRFAPTVA